MLADLRLHTIVAKYYLITFRIVKLDDICILRIAFHTV